MKLLILILIPFYSFTQVSVPEIQNHSDKMRTMREHYKYADETVYWDSGQDIIREWEINISCDTCLYESIFRSNFKSNTIYFTSFDPLWKKFVIQADYIDVGGVIYEKISKKVWKIRDISEQKGVVAEYYYRSKLIKKQGPFTWVGMSGDLHLKEFAHCDSAAYKPY